MRDCRLRLPPSNGSRDRAAGLAAGGRDVQRGLGGGLCALGGADRRASDDAGVREHETVGRAGGASSGAPPGQGTGGGPPWEPVNQAQAGGGESLEKRRTQRFGGHLVARTRHRYWIG